MYSAAAALPALPSGPVLRALRDDVASQGPVVAPPAFVSVAGTSRYGWWSFAAGTPYALGKMELGGGQDLSEQAQLRKLPNRIAPFIKFDGNLTKCFVSAALTGVAGEAAQAQLSGCMIASICQLIGDLIAAMAAETAQEMVGDIHEIEELKAIAKAIAAAAVKAAAQPDRFAAGCAAAIGGALE